MRGSSTFRSYIQRSRCCHGASRSSSSKISAWSGAQPRTSSIQDRSSSWWCTSRPKSSAGPSSESKSEPCHDSVTPPWCARGSGPGCAGGSGPGCARGSGPGCARGSDPGARPRIRTHPARYGQPQRPTRCRGKRGDTMLVAFSVSPVGTGEAVGAAVAEAVRVVRESGLPNRTDAMFTTIEGEWDEVMAVVKAATDAVAASAPRVSLVLKADIRPGFTDMLTAKIASVERHLEV